MHNTNDENVLLQASKKLLFHIARARRTGSTKIGVDVADLEVLGQLCEMYSKAASTQDADMTALQEELVALEYFKQSKAVVSYDEGIVKVQIGDQRINSRTLYKAYQYFTGTK